MKHFRRLIAPDIMEGLRNYPVTALLGPRQCGKSTLVKHLLSYDRPFLYIDLEKPSDLRKLDDPEWFFTSQKEKLICIDEIQRKPDLFPLIRSLVDEWGDNGHFLVLGSASRDLLKQSSESLAGRITYKQLTPFLWEEVKDDISYEHYLTAGGFPRSLLQKDPEASLQWREDFITTFLERDILQWSGCSPSTMRKLWQMLAHNNGQTINLSTIGGSIGISHTTVRNYLDILHETFMVHSLPPFTANTKKRIIKSPKFYIADTGIVAGLLGLRDFNQLAGHPVFGSLWESLVLNNLKGMFPRAKLSYYRTSHGADVDIILQLSEKIISIECKASVAPVLSKGTYAAIADIEPHHSFVAAPINQSYQHKPGITVAGLTDLINEIRNITT